MAKDSAWRTRESLLERIKDPQDEHSWNDFVHYYRPFIYNLARSMNIAHHDAEEIVQNVLLKSWNKLPEFEYDRGKGRFRGWLCRVTGNCVRDMIRKRHKSGEQVSWDQSHDQIGLDEFGINLPEIDQLAEKEWKRYISGLAWNAVETKFKPQVIKAFLMAVQGTPMKAITDELGIANSSVYVYKTRVQRELRAEIIRLNRHLG